MKDEMKIRLYNSSGRIEYLDIMKGFGILLLLLSHSISGESILKIWIFSFHMPLFFWCTGYIITMKNPCREELQGKLGRIMIRKSLAILVPYVVFSLLIIFYQVLLQLLHSHTFDTVAFVDKLMRIVELRGMESLWFLPCLLLAGVYVFCALCVSSAMGAGTYMLGMYNCEFYF